MSTIQPFSNYVIIRLDPADEKVGASKLLVAPGQMAEVYNIPKRTGTVRAVGRGMVTASGAIIPPQAAPGDRVFVLDTKGIEITVEFEGESCLVLSDESHIIGKITG